MADDIHIKVTHVIEGLASADALGHGSTSSSIQDLTALEMIGQQVINQNPDNNKSKGMDDVLLGLERATNAMNKLATGITSSGTSSKTQQIGNIEKVESVSSKNIKSINSLLGMANNETAKEVYKFKDMLSEINKSGRKMALAGLVSYGINQAAQAAAFSAQGLTIGSDQYNQFKVNQAAAIGSAAGGILTAAGFGMMASGAGFIPGAITAGIGTALNAGSTLYQAYAGANVTNKGRANLLEMGSTDPRAAQVINMLATQGSKIASQIPYYQEAEQNFQRYKSGGPQEAYNMAKVIAQYAKNTNVDMTNLIQPMSYLEAKYGTGSGTSFMNLFKNVGSSEMASDLTNISNLASMTSMNKADLMNFAANTIPLGVNYQQAATSMMLQPKITQAVADLMLKSVVGRGITLEGLTHGNKHEIKEFEAWEKSGSILGRDAQGKPVYANQVFGQSIVGTNLDQTLEGVSTVNIKASNVNVTTDKEPVNKWSLLPNYAQQQIALGKVIQRQAAQINKTISQIEKRFGGH